jgi:hypothetical protein
LSYQHCPVHRLNDPHLGSVTSAEVRSVHTGEPVATSSLRKTRLNCTGPFGGGTRAPVWPSLTYARVLPFGSVVTAIHGSVVVIAEFNDGLICVHVAPASVERQTPLAYDVE